jgi:hypothetical protein
MFREFLSAFLSLALFCGSVSASTSDFSPAGAKLIQVRQALIDSTMKYRYSVCDKQSGACEAPFDSVTPEEYERSLEILQELKTNWHWKYTSSIVVGVLTVLMTLATQLPPVLLFLGLSYKQYTDGYQALTEMNRPIETKIGGLKPAVVVEVSGVLPDWVEAIKLLNQEARDSLIR